MHRAVTGVLFGALILTGCSSTDGPRFEVGDLSAGACAEAGPSLLVVEQSRLGLAAGELEPRAVATDFESAQAELLAVREQADEPVAGALRELVTTMGFFRIGAVAGTTNEAQQEQLKDKLDDTLTACGVDLDQG